MRTPEEKKAAKREDSRKYREAHREQLRELSRKYYATHRVESSERSKKHRRAYLDKTRELKYGVTPEQYAQMLKDQDGVCAICGKKPTKRALGVDHDHTTGAVRGLLCMKCNLLVGYVESDLSKLHKAVEYVESHAKLV